jgi:hypothetical protein
MKFFSTPSEFQFAVLGPAPAARGEEYSAWEELSATYCHRALRDEFETGFAYAAQQQPGARTAKLR